MSGETAPMTASYLRRVIAASLIGGVIEWYDFFLYGIIAGLAFGQLYFPTGNHLVSVMISYATFAVGFVTRPLGGVIFGHFGDKLGRKSMLVITLLIMGIATTLIGLLPTYDQIGIAAPILLLLLRVFQGIGIGGEWGGAILMAYETAPEERRGFYASLPQIGLAIGLCLASGVVALMSALPDATFLAWGWRVGFLLSIVLVALGMYIRLQLVETPEFAEVKAREEVSDVPILDVARNYGRETLIGMGARLIDGVFFNIFAVFSVVYLSQYAGISRSRALWDVTLAAVVMVAAIPCFGRLSDVWGRPRTYALGSLLLAISAFPAFALMGSGVPILATLGVVVPLGIIYAICYGPEAALFADLFEPRVRYTGISFVYQFSGIFASGIAPMVATYLLSVGKGNPRYVCMYVVIAGLISMVSALAIRSKRPQHATLAADGSARRG